MEQPTSLLGRFHLFKIGIFETYQQDINKTKSSNLPRDLAANLYPN
jgi:hypothetical protein